MIFFIKFIGIISFIFSSSFYTKHSSAENQINSNKLLLDSVTPEDKKTLEQTTTFKEQNPSHFTDLSLALEERDLDRIQQILSQKTEKGESISSWDIRLTLILFFNRANLKAIQEKIEKKEKLNDRDKYGLTPLHYMSHIGDLQSVKQLLSLKVDLKIKDKYYNKTPLYYALSNYNIDTSVELVLAGADVNESNYFSETLLQFILEKEDLKLTKILIEKGADVNTRNPANNETALHLAVKKGSLNDIEYLLNKGIDMGIRNKVNGKTAFHLAIQQENLPTVKAMIKKEEPLYQMALLNPSDYISYYRFTALYKRDLYGRTVLDLTNNKEILDLLISAGAPIDALDKNNRTLLERAWKAKDLEKVKFLAERGAELNKRDEKDKTLLHYTFKEEAWEEKANFLIELGADVNSQKENKRTLIYYILKRGNLSQLKFLLDKGAKPNIQDDLGQTPLHYAVKKGWFNKAKVLVKNGADPTIKDNKGKTAGDLTNWTVMKDYLKKQELSFCKDIFTKSVDSI